MAYDVDDLISTARKRLEQARSSDQHNREQARLDLQFLTLQQWDESQKTAREKQNPPRPCIVADRLTAFWNQVTNEVRRAQPSPRVAPRGSGATKATAEVMEGIVRRILYDSDSQLAFTEAAKYAIGSSFGAFRMDPELVNEDTNQHEIRVNPIYDPSTVYWDPFAKRPDKSDARWCLVVNVISRTEYAERWPDAEQSAGGFTAKDADVAEWLDPDGDKESVMVAEYWCVEEVDNAVALDKASDGKMPKSRGPRKKRVVCHIIDGVQELEEPTERPGKYIPIFQVEGNSVWVNGLRYVLSLIRGARDPQRILNWQETRLIELLAVQSNAPFWLTPKQAEGHEEQLRNAPNQNHFYLPYNPDPSAPGPPQRQNAEVPIAELSQAIAMKAQELRDIIGLQAPNLGGGQSSQQSGFAIQQLRTEGDTGTYHFTANLERTLKHFCRVLMDWIPVYYDVEQEMRILKADMTEDLVTVNSQTPVQPATGGAPYLHDLTQGNYECVVEVGPAYDTARLEEATFLTQIIQGNPDAFWVIGDLAVRYRDSVGADEAADRIKRAIALRAPGLIQDNPNAMPPGATAQMQAMQAQLQQLQQLVQQQALEIKTRVLPKQIEAQSRMQLESVRSKTSIAKALIDLKGKIHTASLQHGHAMYDTTLREATDAVEHLMGMFQESELAPAAPEAGGLHPAPPPPTPAAANGAPQ